MVVGECQAWYFDGPGNDVSPAGTYSQCVLFLQQRKPQIAGIDKLVEYVLPGFPHEKWFLGVSVAQTHNGKLYACSQQGIPMVDSMPYYDANSDWD